MKKNTYLLTSLLIASLWTLSTGGASAQQIRPVKSTTTNGATAIKHVYFRGGKTHFIVQHTQTGTHVFRQAGNRLLPMH